MQVGDYFKLQSNEMNNILKEVKNSVKQWEKIATEIGIPRSERNIMAPAFKF
jgi:serine/threonine-protein kinase HipA